jgi:hypothetical protein
VTKTFTVNIFKHFLFYTFVIYHSIGFSQLPDNFGKLTPFEKQISSYEKDSTANAVVLYERGDNYFKVIDNRIRLVKEYHGKIKIFNEKAFDHGTIKIQLYHNDNVSEKLAKISAITHNKNGKFRVLPDEIFTSDLSERWKEKTFTFPKLESGSVLEYTYTIETPFDFNFTGWNFQTSIPVLYSEFNAKIPGNWTYNRSLTGSLKLDVNEATIKKHCFHIDGIAKDADCEVLKYVMKDVPAFEIDEDFMLGHSNYRASINFELSEYKSFDGGSKKYTKSWKDVDQEFRSDKDIGRQLTKNGFFEKNVSEKLLLEGDPLTKAKNIYSFVQEHYTWNEEMGIYGKARVKEAFDEKKGNVSEINISLINLLNAAGIKTNLMLLSTRKSGLPKRVHPVMSDFNYCIAKTEIDGKEYLLDATDKYITFGMLPFRALNHYGRVMDFKNESYWYDIRPERNNRHQVRAQLKFDIEEKKGFGVFDVVNLGYNAVTTREVLDRYDEDEYLNSIEEDIEGGFSITSYQLRDEYTTDIQVSQRFEFELENILNGEMVYLNPFLIRFFEKNPFLLDERQYPVDFGYPRHYKYSINISVPEGYKVHELPEKQAVQLGDKMAVFQFLYVENANQISLTFDLSLNSSHIKAENYQGLKNVFKHVTDVQNNSLIVFKKI